MERVVVVYLDDEGIECFREEYSVEEAKRMFGEVIDRILKSGKRYGMVGDKIVMLMGR